MSNKIKRKNKTLLNKIKEWKILQFKCSLSNKRFITILITILLIIVLGIVTYKGIMQYKDLKEVSNEMEIVGASVQLGYHREFNLIERLNILEVEDFKQNCEEFSFDCLYQGNIIRKKFLGKLETESFNDEDIEVLNMVSSMDISVRKDSEKYNLLIEDYNKILEEFPLSVVNSIIPDRETLL